MRDDRPPLERGLTKRLDPFQEVGFKKWYAKLPMVTAGLLDPDPDSPGHLYDWRAAFASGISPNESNHWPSQFKMPGHEREVLGGVSTVTGQAVSPGAVLREFTRNIGGQ